MADAVGEAEVQLAAEEAAALGAEAARLEEYLSSLRVAKEVGPCCLWPCCPCPPPHWLLRFCTS